MKVIYGVLILLLAGCSNPTEKAPAGTYYDLKSYVEKQIAQLDGRKPTVVKQVSLDGKQEQETDRNINWSRELELFLQADINKQAYQASYQQSRPDSLTYEYRLKPTEHLAVQFLRVELDPKSHQPRRVEAVLKTKNTLYESERKVWLESENGNVRRYHVEGFQQLAWLDKKPFLVEGTIQ